MKWKNIDNHNKNKTIKYSEEVKIEKVDTKEEFKELAKKIHPDLNDPFFKKRNTKKMQRLNEQKRKVE